jgi:LCP family protein required for cell wall assembly
VLGRWRRGVAMLLTALCLLGLGFARPSRGDLSRLLLRPSWLLALLALDGLLLAFRLACVVDAYRLGSRDAGSAASAGAGSAAPASAPVAAALALVLAVTIAPHAVLGYYDVQAYDLLTSVFNHRSGPAGGPLTPQGRAAPLSAPGPVTILLIGGDAGPDRVGLRADTMIVVSVRPATGRIVLFGLPRNLVRVPLPRGPDRAFPCRCFPRPLNELYAFAKDHPALFPGDGGPGVNALLGAAQQLLGIRIDYHALVDLKGFVDVVNALGGVTIRITEPIHVDIDRLGSGPGPAFDLQPGQRHLDGLTALAYVRSRKTTSDYDRMRRQRCLLGALAGQTDAGRMLRAFPSLVRVAKRDVSTDIPLDQLPTLIGTTSQHHPRTESVGFTPPDYVKGWAMGGYPIPDVARIRRTVRATLRQPEVVDVPARGGSGGGSSTAGAGGGGAAAAGHQSRGQPPDPCLPPG